MRQEGGGAESQIGLWGGGAASSCGILLHGPIGQFEQ